MEQERKNKRKDRIKNAAIIFLIVMLVLTLFSNTILNFSLPQVAVVMPGYASISEQIRGSGTIEAAATTDVKINEARTIGAIMVSVGDTVTEGQTLFTFSDDNESRLEELQVAYDKVKNEYDKMLLGTGKDYSLDELEIKKLEDQLAEQKEALSDLPRFGAAYEAAKEARETAEETQAKLERDKTDIDGIITDLAGGNYDFLDENYSKQIEEIQNKIDTLTQSKADSDERVADLESKIAETGDVDLSSYRQALDAAIQAVYDKQDEITQALLESENADGTAAITAGDRLIQLYAELADLQAKQTIAEGAYNAASSKISTATGYKNRLTSENGYRKNLARQIESENKKLSDLRIKINREYRAKSKDLADKIAELKKSVTDLTSAETEAKEDIPGTESEMSVKVRDLEYQVETAKLTLAAKQETDAAAAGQSAVDLKAKKDEVDRAKAKLDEATESKTGGEIKATTAGVITTISAVSGQTTSAGDTLCSIALVDNGYQLKFSVSNDQARRVAIGVSAEVMYYWYGDASAKLAKITNDPSDPSNKKLLTFTITGDVSLGNSLQLSVGERSADYSSVIPSSAIREDNNGKFVLACVSKNTPFGSRYTAERIPVNVVATNGQSSAIDGSIENGVWVITTSTKPIAAGTQVRLQNS
ncbi:MAG: HlyD family efflux transporter periplasmic adaptor subunit [Ruminococcus sp.]|jgi:biotin carboxyl carrier protein|nr:HlyD family efflux transporter periplasmic adaptor subunit [Ruminococcus sp.]